MGRRLLAARAGAARPGEQGVCGVGVCVCVLGAGGWGRRGGEGRGVRPRARRPGHIWPHTRPHSAHPRSGPARPLCRRGTATPAPLLPLFVQPAGAWTGPFVMEGGLANPNLYPYPNPKP